MFLLKAKLLTKNNSVDLININNMQLDLYTQKCVAV